MIVPRQGKMVTQIGSRHCMSSKSIAHVLWYSLVYEWDIELDDIHQFIVWCQTCLIVISTLLIWVQISNGAEINELGTQKAIVILNVVQQNIGKFSF